MFCEKCGAPVQAGERFCGNCGSPILWEMDQNYQNLKNPKKKSKKGLIIGICTAVLVVGGLTAGALTAFHIFSAGSENVSADVDIPKENNQNVNSEVPQEKETKEYFDTELDIESDNLDNESDGGDAFEEAIHQTSFWGVWCKASKQYEEVKRNADDLISMGYHAQVVLTSDWANLNQNNWYAVTAGMYGSETEAIAELAQIQNIYEDAYVKYSGEYQGFHENSSKENSSKESKKNDTASYPTCQVVHCNEFITLREVPNTSGNEICKIPLGADVSYIENSENGFVKVEYSGYQGYCLVSYLDFYDYSNGQVMTVYKCNESITLRKIPSTKGEEICQIPLGADVVFRSTASNGFYLISYNGYTGYSLAEYLTE